MTTPSRSADALRAWSIEPAPYGAAPGRIIVKAGRTTVLCTASIEESVPPWMKGQGKGWVTAEYNMLPGSTAPRKGRERGPKIDGRTTEIQRLIGRSLRAIVNLEALGERSVAIDCDVLEADGGTRTASITGAYVALVQALRSTPSFSGGEPLPVSDSIAAVSVGMVDGRPTLDLDYAQDFAAAVDMNVVMTGAGRYVELQGTGEEATFDAEQLAAMLALAHLGIAELTALQRNVLA
ncbi:ribonuclease PH [Lacipirellula limnantheis]|uniref:Ribonuclease PH n=1 Tax=Lacipirellula limnantheis TaxID=2528024 RepID=A0A517TUW3_9BACT|nr:ribonuclease PH [Lacipirellula limnantheis]QDT72176.1 Ribonuclease PH [Lacipirellula limnantheis]